MAAIPVYLPFLFVLTAKLYGTILVSEDDEVSIGLYTKDRICGYNGEFAEPIA